jgi:hypothetical protein
LVLFGSIVPAAPAARAVADLPLLDVVADSPRPAFFDVRSAFTRNPLSLFMIDSLYMSTSDLGQSRRI